MFCHFYMIKVPLVSIFQITNFGMGEYEKWYYKRGIRGKSVGTTGLVYMNNTTHINNKIIFTMIFYIIGLAELKVQFT